MTTSDSDQMPLSGIPQANYPISIYCGRCGHMAELVVGIEVLHSLYRLRCSQCGAGINDLKIKHLSGAKLGG